MLADGHYDVIVIDALARPDGPDELHLDLTILSGVHKGEVVPMRVSGLGMDELDVLGLPGTLVVIDGSPSITIDR